jgi:sugar lactone lactonase YvrE
MKWMKGAGEGISVASDGSEGHGLTQINGPEGVLVDLMGTVYVADRRNHRVTRWCKGITGRDVIVAGNEGGGKANQLNMPTGLSFDRYGNLYVVDWGNKRVQRYTIQETR